MKDFSPNLKFLFVFFISLTAVLASAQQKFDFSTPQGTYSIVDELGKRITLKIQPGSPSGILGELAGKGTISINGKSIPGKWNATECNDSYFLCFHTYGGVKMTYNLPSGPAKIDQIIISEDGRASYNISVLYDNFERNWIKVKKGSAISSKKKSRK